MNAPRHAPRHPAPRRRRSVPCEPTPGARLVAALALGLVLAGAPAVPATATGGSGHLGGGGEVEVGITVITPGFDRPVDLDGDSATHPVVWTVVDGGPARPGDLSGLCRAPDGGFGWKYWLIGRSRDGTIVGERLVCRPFTDPQDPPPPPEPPVLPTIEEVWRRAQLPAPSIGIDPATRGVTGLETRIWARSETTLTLGVTLDGYSVTARAVVVGYTARVDGGPVTRADGPGGPDAPVLRHVFEVKGSHRVSVGAIWRASATFTGPGLDAPLTTPIGEAIITASRRYPVTEVRSVLRP